MIVSVIVAVSENNVIGHNGTIPWNIPDDLLRFKKLTMGCPVIMGRKTHESIGKPLPGRINVVLSSVQIPGVIVCGSLNDALKICKTSHRVFVIGGAQVYTDAMDIADELYLTRVHQTINGDTWFPLLTDSWIKTGHEIHHSHDYLDYTKSK